MKEVAVADVFMSDLVKRAMDIAREAHAKQKRKYTGDPYISHPLAVAGLVAGVGGSKAMVAAALLHDVVEDCGVSFEKLGEHFGPEVGQLVFWLTDVSIGHPGNRKVRKAMDRDHIAKAPAAAKTIKLADLIDNSKSIVERDPDFAKVYMKEKRALLEVLKDGDAGLFAQAEEIVNDYFAKHPELA